MQRQGRQLVKARPAKRQKTEIILSQPAIADVGAMEVISRKRKRTSVKIADELKFLDNAVEDQALVAAATWAGAELDPATTLCLTAPAQGDTASSRDGKQIIAKSLNVKGKVYIPQSELVASPPIGTEIFIALILDKQTNNAQLNSEDVYSLVAANTGLNCRPLRNLNFAKRFKVLKTEKFIFDNTAVSHFAVDSFSKPARAIDFDWFVDLKDMKINFNSVTTGVIGNVLDNSVHVVGIANSTSESPAITYQSRFRFIG